MIFLFCPVGGRRGHYSYPSKFLRASALGIRTEPAASYIQNLPNLPQHQVVEQ
jgi:hypothetical protein